MPAHYEMVCSHSPPVSFLSTFGGSSFSSPYDGTIRSCRPQVLTPPQSRKSYPPLKPLKMVTTPKSCLVIRSPEEIPDPESPIKTNGRTKKKVIFADDQGLSLTHIKIMSEPSNLPPVWSLSFLAQITQGLISPTPSEQWTVDFRQPASEYLEFRRKIDDKNVSLENVIVKENESVVVGTIKVKNISFEKEVIVRATWDDWSTQEDIFCTFSQIYGPSSAYVIYDTFSFKITLPPSSRKLEFCVCFKADDKEYWDNNDKKNYTLSKRAPDSYFNSRFDSTKSQRNNYTKNNINSFYNSYNSNKDNNSNLMTSELISLPSTVDNYASKVNTWSEFPAWSRNDIACPYW